MRTAWISRLAGLAGLAILTALALGPASVVMAGGSDRPVSGVLAAASGAVSVRPMTDPAAVPARLGIGKKIFFGDEIITAPGVRAQILLRDGTTFSIGEGATLVLDEFVYDPASGDGGIGVVLKKGAFRFVSGKIAKKRPQNMRVLAGSASIAVRGTEVIGTIGGGGGDTVILISGQIDLASVAGECVTSSSAEGGDMFSISPDGSLEFKADVAASPPAFCNRSLVRSGFGVQVGASGQLSIPGRVNPELIDTVIDAVTIRNETSGSTGAEDEAAPESAQEEADTGTDTSSASPAENDQEAKPEEESAPASGIVRASAEPEPELLTEALPAPVSVVEPVDEAEQGGLSEFDKVVMRAFGMMEEEPADKPTEDAVVSGAVLELAVASRQAAEDEEKAAAQDQMEDRGLTEEERLREYRVGTATEEQSSDDDDSDGGAGDASANNAPVLGTIAGIGFSDTASDDSFSNSTGALAATDSDAGDALTYSITGGSANSGLAGFDLARSGTYGTLSAI